MKFNLIVAHSFPKYGIGLKGKLPWRLSKDMVHFKNITSDIGSGVSDPTFQYVNSVIMGRKTWESIPDKFRPLENRFNIIITNSPEKYSDKYINNNLVKFCRWDNLLQSIMNFMKSENRSLDGKIYQISNHFIIGGSEIYNMALSQLEIANIYTTEVYQKGVEYDAHFPKINYNGENTQFKQVKCGVFEWEKVSHERLYFRFMLYRNRKCCIDIETATINKEEANYLSLMQYTLEHGLEREDRTGTGTISSFGNQLRFNLADTFPLSTTKKMFFRAIFEELMLYLRGQTDNGILVEKGIHIWDGNTSREFLDKRGLTNYPVGDMGETYGFNFRHFGGKYENCKTQYNNNDNNDNNGTDNNGFDQLSECIKLIKEDPTSRRIIINLWNPAGNTRAALPSCLCMYQFYVDTIHHKLNLQIYIRSSDYFLANNWNTCTGALLVHMICRLSGVNLTPGTLSVIIGDTHLYKTHLEQVRENLKREPYPFPMLLVKEVKDDITTFQFEDFELLGYKAHPRISADMAV